MKGTSHRLSMYAPNGMVNRAPTTLAAGTGYFYLSPLKKVLRDTLINQYTWYMKFQVVPPALSVDYVASVALYRMSTRWSNPIGGGGANVMDLVPNSTVTSSGTVPALTRTQWALAQELLLEGGTYYMAFLIWNDDASASMTLTNVGVTSADTNLLVPVYTGTLANSTLPTTLHTTTHTLTLTGWWEYGSGEWM